MKHGASGAAYRTLDDQLDGHRGTRTFFKGVLRSEPSQVTYQTRDAQDGGFHRSDWQSREFAPPRQSEPVRRPGATDVNAKIQGSGSVRPNAHCSTPHGRAYGCDFIDLHNPKVCHSAVGLEQRIVIGAEMSRGAPIMDGDVEHAADVGGIDGTTMHADSDKATRKLVHTTSTQ